MFNKESILIHNDSVVTQRERNLLNKLQFFVFSDKYDNNQSFSVLLVKGDLSSSETEHIIHFCQQQSDSKKVLIYINLSMVRCLPQDLISITIREQGIHNRLIKDDIDKKIVLILDDYNVCEDISYINLLGNLKEHGVEKIIILCNEIFLELNGSHGSYQELLVPRGYGGSEAIEEYRLQGLSEDEIKECIGEASKQGKKAGGWSESQHEKVLEQIPGIKELLSHPIMLTKYIAGAEEIIKYSDEEIVGVTCIKLYEYLFTEWIKSQVDKIERSGRLVDSREEMELDCWEYAEELANGLYESGDEDIEIDINGRYESLLRLDSDRKSKARDACPLEYQGSGKLRFISRGLQGYLAWRVKVGQSTREKRQNKLFASQINIIKISDLDELRQDELNQEVILGKQNRIQFEVDELKCDPNRENYLIGLILASRSGEVHAVGSTNAITILNYAGFAFSNLKFSGVIISAIDTVRKSRVGADLRNAILDSTDLENADLRRTLFYNAWMREANLSKALLEGVSFGQNPHLAHDYSVRIVKHSYDGKKLITASGTKITIWDSDTCIKEHIFEAADRSFTHIDGLDWSIDRNFIISGSRGGVIKIWDIVKKNCIILAEDVGFIECIALSPDLKYLVTDQGKDFRIWDFEKKECLYQIKKVQRKVASNQNLCFNRSGDLLFVLFDNGVLIWEKSISKVINWIQKRSFNVEYEVRCMSVNPDGNLIAVGDDKGNLYIYDISGNKLRGQKIHNYDVTWLSWCYDGKYIASTSRNNLVTILNIELGTKLYLNDHRNATWCVSWHPFKNEIATASSDRTVRIWLIDSIELPIKRSFGYVSKISLNSDGHYLGMIGADIVILDTKDFQIGRVALDNILNPIDIAWHPNNADVFAMLFDKDKICLFDICSNKNRFLSINSGRRIHGEHIAFSFCGQYLAISTWGGVISIVSLQNGKVQELGGESIFSNDHISCLAWEPKGDILAVGDMCGRVSFWDTKKCEKIKVVNVNLYLIRSVVFCPVNRTLAIGGHVTVCIKELQSWTDKIKWNNAEVVNCVAFSPNGQYLAIGGGLNDGGYLCVRNISTWKIVFNSSGYTEPVNSIFWVKDHLAVKDYNNVTLFRITDYKSFNMQLIWGKNILFNANRLKYSNAKVQGLTDLQEMLLKQRGAITENEVVNSDFVERKYKNEGVQNVNIMEMHMMGLSGLKKLKKIEVNSLMDESNIIDYDSWIISFVDKSFGSDPNNVCLLFEAVNSHGKCFFISYDLKPTPNDLTLATVNKRVRYNIDPEDRKAILMNEVLQQECIIYVSWKITRVQALVLKRDIEDDLISEVWYNQSQSSTELTKDEHVGGHSTYTWICEKMNSIDLNSNLPKDWSSFSGHEINFQDNQKKCCIC